MYDDVDRGGERHDEQGHDWTERLPGHRPPHQAACFVIDGEDAGARNYSENIDLDQYCQRSGCTGVVPAWRKFQCADWL
jgi:hypothetical protein